MKKCFLKDDLQMFMKVWTVLLCLYGWPLGMAAQSPIEIEFNSGVGKPHFQITEIGQDFTRMTFKNTANPGKFWTIAAEPHTNGIPRVNFFYNNGELGKDRFTVTGDGRVGINTTNPASNLHVIGDVRISDLASNGTRNVVANSAGQLLIQEISGGYSGVVAIPHTSFISILNPDLGEFKEDKSYAYHEQPALTQREWLDAAIHLPHGATIKKIESHLYDNVDGQGVVVGIYRYGSGLNIGNVPANWTEISNSTGQADAIQTKTKNLTYTIDNINYAYVIQARAWSDGDGNYSFNWPSENVGVQKIIIYYE